MATALRERVVIVTGAAKGIGRSTAQCFLEAGDRVVLWDVDTPALAQAAQETAALKAETMNVDVSDPAMVTRAVDDIVAR
jgi:NAD(P)-dependent dehydrogenase (short-subunit alcohol dehydrogenase family)